MPFKKCNVIIVLLLPLAISNIAFGKDKEFLREQVDFKHPDIIQEFNAFLTNSKDEIHAIKKKFGVH